MIQRICFIGWIFILLIPSWLGAGTTGKLSGKVIDVETGEPMIGANIIVEEMWQDGRAITLSQKMGASSDMDGYFVILNLMPGAYNVKCQMIGYATTTQIQVKIEIDLTTNLTFELKVEAIKGDEIVIVAEKEIIKRDVAASQTSIDQNRIKQLPAASVTDVVGQLAGVTSNLEIRGSAREQTLFMVDGISLRDERTNKPISNIPLSAIQDISVQTGGFSAEYNNVRSGIVNVVTREGDGGRYTGAITYRHRPAMPKHFGVSPYDANSFWFRSYLDDEVCWTGTNNGAWDSYTQRQYPSFNGWNYISEQTMSNDDPADDLSPYAAQRLFKWQKRKNGDIDKPDYTIDAGFGGPVPFIGKKLGNLRFFISTRQEESQYLYAMSTSGVKNSSIMMKLTSDISPSIKLTAIGLYGELYGTATYSGYTGYYETVYESASALNQIGHTSTWRLFTDSYWSRMASYSSNISIKMTHILNAETFYEILVKRDYINYHTGPGRVRDTTAQYEIFPGYYIDEQPFGFEDDPVFGIDGMGMGGSFSQKRDHSNFTTYSARGDFTRQMNKNHQMKTGLEFHTNRFNLSFGAVNKSLPLGNYWTTLKRNPYRCNYYIQDKMEFEGLIATVGLVFDYIDPTGQWYEVNAYDKDFFTTNYEEELEDVLKIKDAKAQFDISPRVALSHPITVNSKLYFNYGHNRQMPTSELMYMVRRGPGNVAQYYGDPSLALAKTISYELGYDHSLFRQYLVHLAAYYKDISDQELWVRYVGMDGKVNYWRLTNNSYEDIRGFELDIAKNAGKWLTGGLNLEYRVNTNGYFETLYNYENPAEMRDYLRKNVYQERPKPRPRLKSNLDYHTPDDWGPQIAGQRILGGWHANFLYYWTAGSHFTWNPNGVRGVEYNVAWRASQNVDLKISKLFRMKNVSLKLFVDVYNMFNHKNFSGASFYDLYDYNDYMYSLHLAQKTLDELGYNGISGDDRPGACRKTGVEFRPMEWITNVNTITSPNERVIYYEAASKMYMVYRESAWSEIPKSELDQVLEDKAYIDMPNLNYFTFLNPRNIFFGLTLTFDLN